MFRKKDWETAMVGRYLKVKALTTKKTQGIVYHSGRWNTEHSNFVICKII